MLASLDRAAQRWVVPVRNLIEGYRWEPSDMRDREWWPQGVTTSDDAGADAAGGRRVVVVSWYAKSIGDAPSRGSRVSFIDISDPVTPRYCHVPLVEPLLDEHTGDLRLRPVRIHAGGLVWLGRTLLVADTRGGLRSFDLDSFVDVGEAGVDRRRYALSQGRTYRAENADDAQPFRFSFVSVDRSGPAEQIVVGEYGTGDRSRRLLRLSVDADDPSAPLSLTDGVAVPIGVESGVGHMQGALVVEGRRYASVSRGRFRRGSMCTWLPGERPREHRATLAVGPEDLSFRSDGDEIWNVSEHPGRRYVYAVPRSAFDR